MDAIEFAKEQKRMCKSYTTCGDCPFVGGSCVIENAISDEDCKRIVTTVEQWSKEHPRKTRQSVFLEQYPNAAITNGTLVICPHELGLTDKCIGRLCPDCLREFWMQEVE